MDVKMFLRAFPNLRQLHVSATLLSGDSTVGITPDEMPTLSCLHLTLKESSKAIEARVIPRYFYKFVTDSLAVNGISCLSLDARVLANGTMDCAVENLPLKLESNFLRSQIDLSTNTQLHTVVISGLSEAYDTLDGTQLARALSSIQPGLLRRLMLRTPTISEAGQDKAFPSYATLLSQPRFRSLVELYFIRDKPFEEDVPIQERNKIVQRIFAGLVSRGVGVKVVGDEVAREVADRWEQETVAEDK
ncbi:hypothetical protein EIP91_003297 [Steccherinum ochraceum]|uniref:Uncharacterized protein n=1 Tax=Steccherinum ochraceum TaxID=92696 RepID=A0A4R0RJA4_9APHY|nr:hypothetical protein EIP91_003297 [Steccherinum ochraceum]